MSLKQKIVVVNQFTVKNAQGGSRGATPGDYVLRYMAREGATEGVAPVSSFDSDYVTRYMARTQATEKAFNPKKLNKDFNQAKGLGGIAFGSKGQKEAVKLSMSDQEVHESGKNIQRCFDEGKTVLKTILSFDLDFLKEHGLVRQDLKILQDGDYRGEVDQMRLRDAIAGGMDKLSRRYDDLAWVGVLQFDTKHVHAHLAMVDQGEGRLRDDGEQSGMLYKEDFKVLRRGIDNSLDRTRSLQRVTSQIGIERQNARIFVKKYAYQSVKENGVMQFILASLPRDASLWRAGSHRKEMRKGNELVRTYVENVLDQPGSGFAEAKRTMARYAMERSQREGLSPKEHRDLLVNGEERLIQDAMNEVYQTIKEIPEAQRQTITPSLSVMSMDYELLLEEAKAKEPEPLIEFGFKLRTYSTRLDFHKKEREYYKERRESYETVMEQAAPESLPLYNFYLFEEDYNEKLLSKYQHFLSFLPAEDEYEEDFLRLMQQRERLERFRQMQADRRFKRLSAAKAESYGLEVYGLKGGEDVKFNPLRSQRRLEAMEADFGAERQAFEDKLVAYGLQLEEGDTGFKIKKEPRHDFDRVKALDLHHLAYDFPSGAKVSKVNVDAFVDASYERYEKMQGAVAYLEATGQRAQVQIREKDIILMKETADRLKDIGRIESKLDASGTAYKRSKTVSLDESYDAILELRIQSVVEETKQSLESLEQEL